MKKQKQEILKQTPEHIETAKKDAGSMTIGYNIKATWRNKNGKVVKRDEKANLIAKVGRSVFAALLANDNTNSPAITYGALGNGTTTPAPSDVKLESETIRKAPISFSQGAGDNSHKAFITFVYNVDEALGAHKEFGTFMGGSIDPDTGILFSHLAVDWVKTDQQSLTIDCIYTIN